MPGAGGKKDRGSQGCKRALPPFGARPWNFLYAQPSERTDAYYTMHEFSCKPGQDTEPSQTSSSQL